MSSFDYEDFHDKIKEIKRVMAEGRSTFSTSINPRRRIARPSSSSGSDDSSSAPSPAPSRYPSLRRHALVPDSDESDEAMAVTDAAVPPKCAQDAESSALKDKAVNYDIPETAGIKPKKPSKYGKLLQPSLAVRLERICTTGLNKDTREALVSKCLIPANCKLSKAPILNSEVKQTLTEFMIKRDMMIEEKQKVTASAISCLGQAITSLICSKKQNRELLQLLMTSVRLMSDCQYNDSLTRREFLLSCTYREMSESLRNTKIDSYLFGSNKSSNNPKGSSTKELVGTNVMPSTSNGLKKRKSILPHESSKGPSSKKGRKMSSEKKSQQASTSDAT